MGFFLSSINEADTSGDGTLFETNGFDERGGGTGLMYAGIPGQNINTFTLTFLGSHLTTARCELYPSPIT